MSEKNMGDYSNVIVKVEEDIGIKTEVDHDDTVSSIPLIEAISDERGNVLEFDEEETRFLKPEVIEDRPSRSSNIGDSGTSGGRLKSHVCPECDKAFLYRSKLNEHIDGVHLKVMKYLCGECNHAYTRQTDLTRHLDSVHRKLKRFVCSECDGAFTRQRSLKIHLDSVHRKLRKNTCLECDRAFTQRGHLKRHVDEMHKGIKYTCAECDLLLSSKRSLKLHLDVVHRKLKNFICGECNRNFRQRSCLIKHLKRLHPE